MIDLSAQEYTFDVWLMYVCIAMHRRKLWFAYTSITTLMLYIFIVLLSQREILQNFQEKFGELNRQFMIMYLYIIHFHENFFKVLQDCISWLRFS